MELKYGNADRIAIGLSILFLVLYIILREPILGILCALFLVIAVVLEISEGIKRRGWQEELKDTVVTIGAIVVIWLALSFVLNTSSPINAVVSCSMLPNLERGDVVIIYGGDIRAPEVQATEQEVAQLSHVFVEWDGRSEEVNGSALSECTSIIHEFCAYLYNVPSKVVERRGMFEFDYGWCYKKAVKPNTNKERYVNIEGYVPCFRTIKYKGRLIENKEGDIVVYAPKQEDAFSRVGDIIHRVILKIKTESNEYYIIKGDNNEIADIQIYSNGRGNSVVEKKQIKGKVIARIPIIGYLRLFLSGYVEDGSECRYNLQPINQ